MAVQLADMKSKQFAQVVCDRLQQDSIPLVYAERVRKEILKRVGNNVTLTAEVEALRPLKEALRGCIDRHCEDCDDGVPDEDGHYICSAHSEGYCADMEPFKQALADARRVMGGEGDE